MLQGLLMARVTVARSFQNHVDGGTVNFNKLALEPYTCNEIHGKVRELRYRSHFHLRFAPQFPDGFNLIHCSQNDMPR